MAYGGVVVVVLFEDCADAFGDLGLVVCAEARQRVHSRRQCITSQKGAYEKKWWAT